MVLMVLGISLYSAITATITSIMITSRAAPNTVDMLERLARMASDGSLSPEEFERAKATIIG
jgi:predicted Zn-dependent peptidase